MMLPLVEEKANMLKKSINSAISFGIHVNAEVTPNDARKKVFPSIRVFFGASDYGPFSAHSPSLLGFLGYCQLIGDFAGSPPHVTPISCATPL
jgi:hypothetical protein